MSKTYTCDQCGATIPFKWRDAGALRMQISYTNGGNRNVFTCAACREKNIIANGEPIKPEDNTWQPAATLPDADTTVIVHHADWDEPLWLGYWDGNEWHWVEGEPCDPQPTHWMDFPEPPEVNSTEANGDNGGGKS